MASAPVEGWYPAPGKDGFVRWWDGTQWTDHEKPAPTDIEQEQPDPPAGKPVEAPGPKKKSNKREAITNAVGATGLAAAGAALAADGAIGLGKKRKGFKGLGKYFVIGILLILVSFMVFVGGIFQAIGAQERDSASGVVTSILSDGTSQCIPTVEYVYSGKKAVTRENDYVKCVWQEGDPVLVFFDAATGENVTIGEDVGSPIPGSLIMGIIGWFILGIGIVKLAIRAGSVAGGLLLMREGFKLGKGKDSSSE